MAKIDESKLPLDLQAIILTGMTFDKLRDYVEIYVLNDEMEGQEYEPTNE